MTVMSPLARILVGILHKGSWAAAALIILFAVIHVWRKWQPDGSLALTREDYGFLGILAALLILAIYLVKAIKKELKNPGG